MYNGIDYRIFSINKLMYQFTINPKTVIQEHCWKSNVQKYGCVHLATT